MIEPFLGEIRLMAFAFAPRGWALCDGQLMPINQNQALFALLGTTYGGNGQTTFALPDLRGRVPLHRSGNLHQGQAGGTATHTLTAAELPTHTHQLSARAADGDRPTPVGGVLARSRNPIYAAPGSLVALGPGSVSAVGGGQPHDNMAPSLVLSMCIALQGIFPTQH
jgi:microcystin-dependent protein